MKLQVNDIFKNMIRNIAAFNEEFHSKLGFSYEERYDFEGEFLAFHLYLGERTDIQRPFFELTNNLSADLMSLAADISRKEFFAMNAELSESEIEEKYCVFLFSETSESFYSECEKKAEESYFYLIAKDLCEFLISTADNSDEINNSVRVYNCDGSTELILCIHDN